MSDNEMQSTEEANTRTVSIRAEIWHALPKIAGGPIDPENAELHWQFEQVVDPYEVYPRSPARVRWYFARAPGSRMGIDFGDLPEATREALWMQQSDGHLPSRIDAEVPF